MCSNVQVFSSCAPPTCCGNGRVYRSYADAYFPSGFGAVCGGLPVACTGCPPGYANTLVPWPVAAATAAEGVTVAAKAVQVAKPVGLAAPCAAAIPTPYAAAIAAPCGVSGYCGLPTACVGCERPFAAYSI